MERRTKIVCTLGPASSDEKTIQGLVEAGMDVARLNFSHGTHAHHREVIKLVRKAAADHGRVVPILQDLQGPKIRVGEMENDCVDIVRGEELILTTDPIASSGNKRVYVNYPTLVEDVQKGASILLDDGALELIITEVREREVVTEVVVGGPLRSRKGVNLPNIKTSTPSLTEKDLEDLTFGLSMGVDIIALSFVRDESDVTDLIWRVRESGQRVAIIAKIEKPEAVTRVDQILSKADGMMVARGDLGIEMALSQLPGIQKRIIRKCREAAKPVITATQMLESMITNPRPTRAEVSDVANAVLDGTDAVMLSGETAVGHDPVNVVRSMVRIVMEAEKHFWDNGESQPDGSHSHEVTEAVSKTAYLLARQVGAVAIASLTATGTTARSIARHRPKVPVYAFTDDERVVGQLALSWGTKGFAIPFQTDTDKGISLVHETLLKNNLVRSGDLVVLTAGMPLPARGRTNMVHVTRV
ncbi:MAG: pyruvate kinase [Rhodothermales bacterium]|jgi:pyruvate kinase